MSLKNTSGCIGHVYVVGLPTAVSLLSLVPADMGKGPPTLALIQAEGQSIRWRADGVSPTSSIGMLIPVNGQLTYDGDFASMNMVQSAASATVNIEFYN